MMKITEAHTSIPSPGQVETHQTGDKMSKDSLNQVSESRGMSPQISPPEQISATKPLVFLQEKKVSAMQAEIEAQCHSAEYFGEQRNFWWNADFIAICAKRWELGQCNSLLDVGCGVGHWTQVLLPHLPPSARIEGIDAEPAWVIKAWENVEDKRLTFRVGQVEKLPFDDDSFDIVTCQTLLIHVADVKVALREMLRVLKPGGRLCLAEPNNLTRSLARAEVVDGDIEEILDMVRFQLVCERGKKLLGQGHNSVGEYLPQCLHELGVMNIDVRLSDKAFSLIPPYVSPPEQAEIKQAGDWSDREFWIWDRPNTLSYFMAGGGDATSFEILWKKAMKQQSEYITNVHQQRAFRAGGVVAYLISGIKPL
jgi:ubiquinone/menaquinone biosynthesis C-methylase UbiE